MPLKVFSADGTGYLSDVLRAIYFAVQNDECELQFLDIFLCYEVGRAFKYATRHRVVCVASAGNDGKVKLSIRLRSQV
jgi:hypothetical protein